MNLLCNISNMSSSSLTFQEQIFYSIIKVNNMDGLGTGFIISCPLKNNAKSVLLLITCKHVIVDSKGDFGLTFIKRSESNADEPDHGEAIHTYFQKGIEEKYYEHPDINIDIAAINITGLLTSKQNLYYKHITKETYSNFSYQNILPGNQVFFIGFPEGRYDRHNNMPILRNGYVASVPKFDYDARPEFLIDAQVFNGSSGSPVFTVVNNNWKLIGMIGKTLVKFSELEKITLEKKGETDEIERAGIYQILGLGVVYKINKIVELINMVVEEVEKNNV